MTFLKTHTKIDNNFIDDFFSLYDLNNKNNFSISITSIVKWFKMKKENIKRILQTQY